MDPVPFPVEGGSVCSDGRNASPAATAGRESSGDPPRIGERALCGIAGYSLSIESRVEQTLATQTLLAAISERGSDAVGYAYRGPGLPVAVHKQRGGASALLDRLAVPREARQALVHVRDYTKGHPSLVANNHPIRHGATTGSSPTTRRSSPATGSSAPSRA